MNIKSIVLSIMPAIMLAACVSAGVKVDQSKMADFHKGETSYSEVVGKLGKPTQVMVSSEGGKTAIYSYVSAQARPESFIPVVGAFVGGADSENSTVAFVFDENDILKSYSSSQGSTGAGTGFEAYSQKRNTAQPGIAE